MDLRDRRVRHRESGREGYVLGMAPGGRVRVSFDGKGSVVCKPDDLDEIRPLKDVLERGKGR